MYAMMCYLVYHGYYVVGIYCLLHCEGNIVSPLEKFLFGS